jgi:hypothetical protein
MLQIFCFTSLQIKKIIEEIHSNLNFRLADINDIEFLIKQDILYQEHYYVSLKRNIDHWKYLLHEAKKTEYGSEFWIIENESRSEKYYFRILLQGYSKGLIMRRIQRILVPNT